MALNNDYLRNLKLSKGYKESEPAMVKFEDLEKLLNQIDLLEKTVQQKDQLIEELTDKIKAERKASVNKEKQYLEILGGLEKSLEKANKAASVFFASKIAKKEKQNGKILKYNELMLSLLNKE